MNSKIKNIFSISLTVLLATLIVGAVVLATGGALTPGAAPTTGTMKTLQDIYTRLTVGTEASEHTLSPAGAPGVTMATLEEIYSAIPTNDKVLKGTNAGTANDTTTFASGHVIAPAAQIIDGYSAFGADGLVIDGTGSAGAPALEWSADLGSMTWDAAVAYCANPANGYTRLPTMKELIGALVGQYIDLPTTDSGFSGVTYYWSGIEYASNPGSAWYADYDSMDGFVYNGLESKRFENSVRCVR